MLPFVAVAAGAYVLWTLADDDKEQPTTPKKKIKRRRKRKKTKATVSPSSALPELPSEPQVPVSEVPVLSCAPPTPSPAEELPVPTIEPSDSVAPQSQTES